MQHNFINLHIVYKVVLHVLFRISAHFFAPEIRAKSVNKSCVEGSMGFFGSMFLVDNGHSKSNKGYKKVFDTGPNDAIACAFNI